MEANDMNQQIDWRSELERIKQLLNNGSAPLEDRFQLADNLLYESLKFLASLEFLAKAEVEVSWISDASNKVHTHKFSLDSKYNEGEDEQVSYIKRKNIEEDE